MEGVITGDIINSKSYSSPEDWQKPLEEVLKSIAAQAHDWDIYRGDSFQVKINPAASILSKAFLIKTHLKSLGIELKMAIGLGFKEEDNDDELVNMVNDVSMSYAEANINSGEALDSIIKSDQTISIRTPWEELDESLGIMLHLANAIANTWTTKMAKMVNYRLLHPKAKQIEIAQAFGISQAATSIALNRANWSQIEELIKYFEKTIKNHSNVDTH